MIFLSTKKNILKDDVNGCHTLTFIKKIIQFIIRGRKIVLEKQLFPKSLI